jgi:hypothetical protein
MPILPTTLIQVSARCSVCRAKKSLVFKDVATSRLPRRFLHFLIYFPPFFLIIEQFELVILGRNGAVVDGVSYLPEDGPVPLKSKALVQIGEASFYFLLPKKLSKLFASSGKSVVENLKTTAGVPSNTGNTLESGAAGAPPAPAAAAAPATTTMPASGSMPSKQEMMQLIQEAAARQQQQQVMAATLASAQQQQQQQLALLSPVQQLALMQQMQHQRQVASSGAANLSPQQQMQMQLLLQQQQLLIRQQQQQQQQNSLPK